MKRMLVPFALLAVFVLPLAGIAQDDGGAGSEPAAPADDPVEYLSLAAVLIGDGNYQRARNMLSRVDPEDEEIDAARFHTLSGLVALNLDELPLAAGHFEDAIEAGQEEPIVWLYLAQAQFGQEKYRQALYALDQAGDDATRVPSVFLMRAQAHWRLGDYRSAWEWLGRGRVTFPDRAGEFVRRQVFLLVEQGLYQEAADQGLAFLESGQATSEDAVAIGNALRQAGQHRQAAVVLEKARAADPDNVLVGKVLSHAYLDAGQTLAAAEVMRTAAVHDAELIADAAELYRRAGRRVQALTLNGQIIDQAKKLKQRLAILLELNRFEQAAGMERDLERVGLLADEDIRYALAYALFKAGDFDASEGHLQALTRSDLFRRATELRRAMEQCADRPWLCG